MPHAKVKLYMVQRQIPGFQEVLLLGATRLQKAYTNTPMPTAYMDKQYKATTARHRIIGCSIGLLRGRTCLGFRIPEATSMQSYMSSSSAFMYLMVSVSEPIYIVASEDMIAVL